MRNVHPRPRPIGTSAAIAAAVAAAVALGPGAAPGVAALAASGGPVAAAVAAGVSPPLWLAQAGPAPAPRQGGGGAAPEAVPPAPTGEPPAPPVLSPNPAVPPPGPPTAPQAAVPQLPLGMERLPQGGVRVRFARPEETGLEPPVVAALAEFGRRLAATSVGQPGGGRVTVVGQVSDPRMDTSTSRRISLDRALAVRAALVSGGLNETRVDVRALGRTEEGADAADVLPPEAGPSAASTRTPPPLAPSPAPASGVAAPAPAAQR